MDKKNLQIIEAIFFLKGNEGISLEEISEIMNLDIKNIKDLVQRYIAEIQVDEKRGFEIKKYGEHFKLVTKKELFDDLNKVVINKNIRLTQAGLETIAIISYKQPITKPEIEKIRGVNSDYAIKKLVLFDLIEEKGRAETPGMPILYGTTEKLLDKFNISSLDELPEFKKIMNDESNATELKLFNYD